MRWRVRVQKALPAAHWQGTMHGINASGTDPKKEHQREEELS